jgi:hypothetical protein
VSLAFALRESLVRHAPVALRIVDAVSGRTVTDQLVVTITPYGVGGSVPAFVTSGGLWSAVDLPGLRTYENGPDFATPADELAARRAARRRFRITVADLAGRYLPLGFDAGLPADDLFVGIDLGALPLPPWPGDTSPPVPADPVVPMFADPAARFPGAEAVISADLAEAGTGREAAWAMLQARIDGVLHGVGLADARGRAALHFPWPERPRAGVVSPALGGTARWQADLSAYYVPRPAGEPAKAAADLAALLSQLSAPRTLLAGGSPPVPLGAVELVEGTPLTLRGAGAHTLEIEVP